MEPKATILEVGVCVVVQVFVELAQREDFVTVLISVVFFLACGFSGKGNGRDK
jgi:hypothetical protein